ncbi:MAG: hypothetical protein GXN91_05310 [Epsilonproteobacteria bacterium]|nr:hypothetical protein [Campylobacterota bacterium]
MKLLRKFSQAAIASGLGAFLVTGLTGCGNQDNTQAQNQEPQKKGAFVIIEEVEKGKYKIKDEFPADETRIVLKELNGTERVLTKEEMDKLIKEEAAKIENNTSNLTNPNGAQVTSQGMGLGEAILASAAGAILGSWIGSKLFGNPNYERARAAGYKSPTTYTRSKSSFNKPRTTTTSTTKKSGFFGSSSTRSTTSKSSGFFGG